MKAIGVVGGGVIGLCAGLELLKAGRPVVIVDDDADAQAASWNNAGHIAAEQVEPLASIDIVRTLPARLFLRGGPLAFPRGEIAQWLPFGLKLLAAARPSRFRAGCAAMAPLMEDALPAWSALVEQIGAPGLLRCEGHFVLWHDERAARAGRKAWQEAETGTARVRPVTAEEGAALTKLCNRPVADAVHFSGTAQIGDLGALRGTLRRAFVAGGGTIVEGKARLRLSEGRAEISGIETGSVLVCAGIRSRALMEALGHTVPMIAERGYHVRAGGEDWPADLPPVVFEERAMIVTRYRDAVQAAGFVELSHPDAPADPRKWQRLERYISELGLPISGPFRRWMGCRPTLPDYLPAIGRSTRADNLYYAFGHQHLGLTLAPITARLVALLMEGAQPTLPLAPFDLERFA